MEDLASTSDLQGNEVKDLESTLESMRDWVVDVEATDMQRLETVTLHLTQLKDLKVQLCSEIMKPERCATAHMGADRKRDRRSGEARTAGTSAAAHC